MHRRSFVYAALIFGAFLAAAPPAAAQVNIALYTGDPSTVVLGSWGSGKAEPSQESVLVGSRSIKVTTQGLYQGARIDYRNPIDLTQAFANPNTYIRLQMRFSGTGASRRVFDPSSTETRSGAASPFERMRFVLVMADGSEYELVRPIDIQPSLDPGSWVSVSFPVSALLDAPGDEGQRPIPTGQAAQLARLTISGDKYQEFYVGEIQIITDQTPITVAPLEEQIAFVNDLLTFTGSAEGGASTLRFSWDFDASDGIDEDKEGRMVQHFWRKPGEYTVTLTVSDVDGIKKPSSSSVTINVSE